jgi:hypothetical protein
LLTERFLFFAHPHFLKPIFANPKVAHLPDRPAGLALTDPQVDSSANPSTHEYL